MEKQKDEKKSSRDYGIIQKKEKDGSLSWYARIVRIEGNGKKKQYTAKADSKSHARRLRDELADKYSERGGKAIEGNKLNFRQVADIYQEKKLFAAVYQGEGNAKRKIAGVRSLKPALHYLDVLREHFGSKLLKSISHDDIELFQVKRLQTPTKRGNRSISDVNRALVLMKTIMKFARQNGWIKFSPFEMGKPLISLSDEVRRERVLSFDEESRLLAACTGKRAHLKPILITALDSAMRKGEILSLIWSNIDFEARLIRIFATNAKTQTARNVGMTARVFNELKNLWEISEQDSNDLVFGLTDIKRSFTAACRDANIEDLHFHDCRHTAITRMVQAGLPASEIMKVSGHTQHSTFQRYVNPNAQAVTRIADVLSAYNSAATIQTNEVIEFLN